MVLMVPFRSKLFCPEPGQGQPKSTTPDKYYFWPVGLYWKTINYNLRWLQITNYRVCHGFRLTKRDDYFRVDFGHL